MSRPLYGGIEAGGTKFVCAAGHGPAEFLPDARVEIPTSSPSATLRAVAAFFEQVCQERGPLSGIGIAAFGPVELVDRSPGWGRILATPKPGWSGTSLTEPLQHFGCPIAIDTDVNAAALAESHVGAGIGLRSVAYVTVGTGIGGGIVIEGRSVRGMLHPEMGHILVRRDPRDAEFGGICPFHRDCLEGLASGPALRARWRDPVADWPQGHPGFEIVGGYLGQLAATVA
ncbi:MAG: ROK family protein, partial [Sciscionella sp.]